MDTDFVTVGDGPSGHAVIQVDPSGQNCILLFGGCNQEITHEEIDRALAHFQTGDYLILQNEINGLDYLMTQAARQGLRIVFNPSPTDESIFRLPLGEAWLLIFNEIEGAALSGCDDEEDILNTLRQRWPRCRLLLTLGSHGCVYDDGQRRLRQGIYQAETVDTPPPEIPSPVTSWPVWRRGVRRRSVWIWHPVRPAHRRVTTRRRSVYPHHGRGAALHPPARGVDRIR